MEIKRYMQLYKTHDPKHFYEWASQGRTMEIRFLSDFEGKKFNNWLLIDTLAQTLNIEKRYNSLFINSYAQLKFILLFKIPLLRHNYLLTRIYNIFISVNPRRKVYVKSKNGLLYKSYYGGIAGTSHIQNILCDIESVKKIKGSASEIVLESCIQGAKFLVKQLNLTNYYINISGNGTHLWFPLEKPIELEVPTFTEYDDKIKYNLKEDPIYSHIKTYNRFIEKLNKMLQKFNSDLMVDEGAKDLSRIARPPGSWNIKIGKTPRAVGTVVKLSKIYNIINHKFMAARPLINKKSQEVLRKASLSKNHRYNYLNIRECPLYKLMVSQFLPSILSRNHYLEQSFARILRDNEIELSSVQDVIREIDIIQRKTVQIDPDYLPEEDAVFNSEMVNSYCVACKIDLVYPILETIPEIKDSYSYKELNTYSWQTVESMIIPDLNLNSSYSYLELKDLIRHLIDANYSRSHIFFTMKYLLKDDWEYYNRNEIISQILNKTRKRK